jgi:hypothetical protein
MKTSKQQRDKMIEYGIPKRMQGAIIRYYERGLQPGNFLAAVIQNDLREAVDRADDENVRLLKEYVMWFYNWAPSGSWGSVDNYRRWLGQDFGVPEEEVA